MVPGVPNVPGVPGVPYDPRLKRESLMKTLHDPSHRGELVRRLEALTPNSERHGRSLYVPPSGAN